MLVHVILEVIMFIQHVAEHAIVMLEQLMFIQNVGYHAIAM
jgi:hypothetical protein